MRFAAWKDRGRHMSAWDMAVAFQWLYFHGSGDRRSGKVPLLGLDLLRCVDGCAPRFEEVSGVVRGRVQCPDRA